MNRRELILGATGAVLSAHLPGAASARPEGGEERRIPSSGKTLPAVGLGSWITFNVGSDPLLLQRSVRVVEAFLREGGGMIDSSPMYGSSQATIGYALAELGESARVFSADKVWTRDSDARAQLDETGRRWGRERFDLLQVHNLLGREAHLPLLLDMREAGTLGYVGVTTSHGRRHADLEQVMANEPVDFVQLTYNLARREAEDRLLPLAADKGIAVIVNRPFQRGHLVDRLQGTPLPGFAPELGAGSWAQLLLKFILAHPAVTCVIPATTQVEHVRENKRAAAGPTPDAVMRRELIETVRQL